jgi:hypothetical protein
LINPVGARLPTEPFLFVEAGFHERFSLIRYLMASTTSPMLSPS